jgi:hypothetical protein
MIADTEVSLPMHPHLTDAEVRRVAEVVTATVRKRPTLFAGGPRRNAAVSALPPERGE